MNWIAIDGTFDFDATITFRGVPTKWNTPQGEERIGLSYGIAMTNASFSEGCVAADVEFDNIGSDNSCELIIYYDPGRRSHLCAGIGGINSAFVIRHFDGSQWQNHAAAGSRASLRPKNKYRVAAKVRGSRVSLSVDGVEVLSAIIPFAMPPSQAGIFCLDDHDVRISNFEIVGQRSRVFVVMQFSSPFNEIHEEVVKKVCEEFDLDAQRADDKFGPGIIIADVIREISESEFVVAEITPSNPNVYYELGYAHAINKPVILLADRKMEKLPFDVSPFRVLFYENSIAGKAQFEEGLRKHIAAIRTKDAIPSGRGSGLTKR